MLCLAIVFAILAIIFGLWGFGTAASVAWSGAVVLFWIFIVLFIVALLSGLWPPRRPLP